MTESFVGGGGHWTCRWVTSFNGTLRRVLVTVDTAMQNVTMTMCALLQLSQV